MKKRIKKTFSVSICFAMMLSMLLPHFLPQTVSASADQRFLTDANGNALEAAGRMSSTNHEIIDIKFDDGKTHKVTIYLLDEDNSGRWSMVDVIDPDSRELLDTQNVHDFGDGVYLTYEMSGHLQLRLTNVWTNRYTQSKDTSVHGIFFDEGTDAIKSGNATVRTEAATNKAASKVESFNVLGRYAEAETNTVSFEDSFTKEAQSIEIRFDGNVDPKSANIDQITVTSDDGTPVEGEMRTSFNSVTFCPNEPMKEGTYTVTVPTDVKNIAGQGLANETTLTFVIEPKVEVLHFFEGLGLMTRRVDLTFNDKIVHDSAPKATIVYNGVEGKGSFPVAISSQKGERAGILIELADKDLILPSGKYTFTLPKGVETVSGAKSTEAYTEEIDFDSKELTASVKLPYAVANTEPLIMPVTKCIGYGEVRWAFGEEAIKGAKYYPVEEEMAIDLDGVSGEQTLYVQFRVVSGDKKGEESPLLHKNMTVAEEVEIGDYYQFDMEEVMDKDGFGSNAQPYDGVFDLETDEWSPPCGNLIADDEWGGIIVYDQGFGPYGEHAFKNGRVVSGKQVYTAKNTFDPFPHALGIEYQLSPNVYKDGEKNVATANGKNFKVKQTNYSELYVLGAGKSDKEEATYILHYADGTSEEHTVEMNYWGNVGSEPVDNIAFSVVRNTTWEGGFYFGGALREYVIYPNRTKELESITIKKLDSLSRTVAITGKEVDKIVFNKNDAVDTTVNTTVSENDIADTEDVLSYTEGSPEADENLDPTVEEFVDAYGDDEVMMAALDTTDVTGVADVADVLNETEDKTKEAEEDLTEITTEKNIHETPVGKPNYNDDILNERAVTTGKYGDSLYPYERQPEHLMSYKVRMQLYQNYELNIEDTLEAIRRVDNVTRGLEKKCYLVGWQRNGHDSSFPDISTFNPRHARPGETTQESMNWLIKEAAEKYNTTITLHVNLSDAYLDDNPLGQEMLDNQLASRNASGKITETGFWNGHKGFAVSAYSNYFSGNFQKNQIAPLVANLPQLKGQSIHPDAWYTYADAYNGLTGADEADAKRRYALHLREKYNMDLTTEFEGVFNPDTWKEHKQDYVLYFPMIWQNGWGGDEIDPMKVPPYFQSGVNETNWSKTAMNRRGRYFGEGTAVEPLLWGDEYYQKDGVRYEKYKYNDIKLPGLKQDFAEKELTRQYFNTLLRYVMNDPFAPQTSYNDPVDETERDGEAILYSGDGQKVSSAWNGNNDPTYKRTVTVGDDVVLQKPGKVFMPMVWRPNLEIQAWSKEESKDTWKLPVEWADVTKVDIYDLSVEGLRYIGTEDIQADRSFQLDMDEDQSMIVVPEGADPNSTEGFDPAGTVQFINRDTTTDGNWTKTYGSKGYEIYEDKTKLGANLPEYVTIGYANATHDFVKEEEKTDPKPEEIKVSSVALNAKSLDLIAGEKSTLSPTVLPKNATNNKLKWTSSNTGVATVSSAGVISAQKAGSATIKAEATDGSGKSASCTVKVYNKTKKLTVRANGYTLNKKKLTLQKGKKATLSAKVATKNAMPGVTYKTNNKNVASVSSKGVIKGKKAGNAKITITSKDGKYSQTYTVKVVAKALKADKITSRVKKDTVTLKKGKTYYLPAKLGVTAKGKKADQITSKFTYRSKNSKIAKVSKAGEITAKKKGTTTITVKNGKAKRDIKVVVKK